MTTINDDDLLHVVGGESTDPTAGLKRAAEQKAGKNSIDIFGYQTNTTNGVGAEYRRRLNDNISVFANGHVGNKDGKADDGVMGGIRFDW
jgi:hypothetical protein